MNPFIYGLVDPFEPDHIRYVGMAMRERRPYEHATRAYQQRASHLVHWILKLHADGRNYQIRKLEELEPHTSRKFLGFVEQCYIASLRKIGHNLTNVHEGGLGGNTGAHTPEVRALISRTHTGRVFSPERCVAISLRTTGNKSKLGQKDSAETRAKKSAAIKAFFAAKRSCLP